MCNYLNLSPNTNSQLHSLHKHAMLAPWVDPTQPLQSLLPAHVLLTSQVAKLSLPPSPPPVALRHRVITSILFFVLFFIGT